MLIFGPQPAALIRNTVDSKACLGTNCITSCTENPLMTLSITDTTQNHVNAVITDGISSSEFALVDNYDFMFIHDGPSTSSPVFANGDFLTGNTLPGSFSSTHLSGAITVQFVSYYSTPTDAGWKAYFFVEFYEWKILI